MFYFFFRVISSTRNSFWFLCFRNIVLCLVECGCLFKFHVMICSKFNIADGMRQMFDPFERVARAHHICPCCERPFSAEEEDEFVKKVVSFMSICYSICWRAIFWLLLSWLFFFSLQQRVKAASSAEHIKVLAMESSNADSRFQQIDKLRLVYEEYVKVGKESIPQAEKNLNELNEELDQKNQALDDVIADPVIYYILVLGLY